MVTTLKFNLCMIETWTFRCQSIYLANYLGISYLIGNLISINSIQNHTATIIATDGGGILWFYNPFNSISVILGWNCMYTTWYDLIWSFIALSTCTALLMLMVWVLCPLQQYLSRIETMEVWLWIKGSLHWSTTVMSWIHLQWDLNPGPHDRNLGVLSTCPPGPSCSKHGLLNELISGQNVSCSSMYNI